MNEIDAALDHVSILSSLAEMLKEGFDPVWIAEELEHLGENILRACGDVEQATGDPAKPS